MQILLMAPGISIPTETIISQTMMADRGIATARQPTGRYLADSRRAGLSATLVGGSQLTICE